MPYINIAMNEETITKVMDLTERYVMTRLYRTTFCPPNTNDEERDLDIQERIRRFHWVNAHILDAQINESNETVRQLVDNAITGKPLFNMLCKWQTIGNL